MVLFSRRPRTFSTRHGEVFWLSQTGKFGFALFYGKRLIFIGKYVNMPDIDSNSGQNLSQKSPKLDCFCLGISVFFRDSFTKSPPFLGHFPTPKNLRAGCKTTQVGTKEETWNFKVPYVCAWNFVYMKHMNHMNIEISCSPVVVGFCAFVYLRKTATQFTNNNGKVFAEKHMG